MQARSSLLSCSVVLGILVACTEPATSPTSARERAPSASMQVASSVQITDLGTMGGKEASAAGINDNGLIFGASEVPCPCPEPNELPVHAFVWQNGSFTDLGTLGGQNSHANAINNSATVVGSAAVVGETEIATMWQNGQATNLGTFGGPSSVAYGINTSGVIVGSADRPTGQFIRFVAFKWQNGTKTDLGVLPGGDWSVAQSINTAGIIAGQGSNSFGNSNRYIG